MDLDPSASLPLSLARQVALAARRGDTAELTRLVLEGARHLTGADRAALVRRRGDRAGAIHVEPAGSSVEISSTVVRRCLEDGAPVLVAGPALQEGGPSASAIRLGLRWVASFPLAGQGLALYLDSRRPPLSAAARVERLLARAAPGLRALGDDRPPGAVRLAPALARVRESATLPPASEGLPRSFRPLVGRAPALREALQVLAGVAGTPLPVLLLGETGTGKELAARALHVASGRKGRLVAENCAALPQGLVESELFGSARGAFTGAERDRVGLLRAAHRGTLFLDEVGDMPAGVQAKLLRVLQEGEVRPLGRSDVVPVDLRVVSATSRRPEEAGLRPDLLYRLGAVTVRLPALRERRDDIAELASFFLERTLGDEARFTREALARLVRFSWPGNVRQLRFEVERAAALGEGGVVEVRHLSDALLRPQTEGLSPSRERAMVEDALLAADGQVAAAARAIGWTRQKLYRRMAALSIERRVATRSAGRPASERSAEHRPTDDSP